MRLRLPCSGIPQRIVHIRQRSAGSDPLGASGTQRHKRRRFQRKVRRVAARSVSRGS